MENIHRFFPITDWALVLPANPIAPTARSTARISAGDGPAVRQSFRRDEGDPECFLLQLCAPFPPGCAAHGIALSPSHLLQGKALFARILELFHHPLSQSSSSLGTNLFHVSILRKPEHHQRRSGRIPKSVTHPLSNVSVIQSVPRAHRQLRGLLPWLHKALPSPSKSNPERRSPVVPLLPSDSGGSWLCNVYMSTELTMATQSSSRLRGEQPNSPGARGACAGLGKELSAAGGAGEVSHTLSLVFSISELQLPKGLFVQLEFLQWPRPCPRSLPLIPAVCWEDAVHVL